jgi:hypothetical protein
MTRPCTFFMLLKATRHWHELGACGQQAELDDARLAVFNGYPDLRMTRYAAGAFHGRCTDVIVWETPDAAQYHDAVESLRQRPFFGAPLFEIVDVVAAVEDDEIEVETTYPPFATYAL